MLFLCYDKIAIGLHSDHAVGRDFVVGAVIYLEPFSSKRLDESLTIPILGRWLVEVSEEPETGLFRVLIQAGPPRAELLRRPIHPDSSRSKQDVGLPNVPTRVESNVLMHGYDEICRARTVGKWVRMPCHGSVLVLKSTHPAGPK